MQLPELTYDTKETWKPIIGYEGFYVVSNFGRIKNNKTGRFLNGASQVKGYRRVFLSGGERKDILIHRLVAVAFILNPENKPCINHIDGNRTNNMVSNLEWVTYRENNLHSIKQGRRKYITGENNHSCKIRRSDALEIKSSSLKWADLAKKFGICMSTVASIKSGRSWSTV